MTEEQQNELHVLVTQIKQLIEEFNNKRQIGEANGIVNELNTWIASRYRYFELEQEQKWKLKQAKDAVDLSHKRLEGEFYKVEQGRQWQEEAEKRRLERKSK